MNKIIASLTFLSLLTVKVEAQNLIRCYTHQHYENYIAQHPEYANKRALMNEQITDYLSTHQYNPDAEDVIEIPVVVHVIYNNSAEDISDAQIQSQIDRINRDFNRQNADTTRTPNAFKPVAGGLNIHFFLAQTDPFGNPTNGILRIHTNKSSFSADDSMKFTAHGGDDAWNTSKYLNIWVCSLSGGVLGYSQFPGIGAPSTDGLVLDYMACGDITEDDGSFVLDNTYDLGRTATHELGHWLNLIHIWGDAYCGNDSVSDTPVAQGPNYGCPTFPHITSCSGQGSNGEMFDNYMDYSDDSCMNIFTQGQVQRMWAAIQLFRSNFVTGIKELHQQEITANVYPNPSTGSFFVDAPKQKGKNISIQVFDLTGKLIYSQNNILYEHRISIDLKSASAAIYLVKLYFDGNYIEVKKLVLK